MLEKVVIGLMSNRKEACVQLAGIQWPVYRGCPDCVKKQMYTKRTPGLFKLEYYGVLWRWHSGFMHQNILHFQLI